MRDLATKSLAEFIGTFAVVFVGCGTAVMHANAPDAVPALAVPLAFGLAVATMIYAVGHVSGAHFNPAVSLAFAIGNHFPPREVAVYWTAQFLGAIAASLLLSVLFADPSMLGGTRLAVDASIGLVWEAVLSFLLMFVIVSVATDSRAEGTMAGVAIGSAVTMGALLGGPVTGASMNPARSFGPALATGEFAGLWVYFAGPALGAAIASLVYSLLRCAPAGDPASRKGAKGCC